MAREKAARFNALFFSILFIFIGIGFCDLPQFNANEYCADMEPQQHVLIEKLMGMWYGVEIISHKHGSQESYNCPVFYFSEDKSNTSESRLYRDYDVTNSYGEGYGYGRENEGYGTDNEGYREHSYPQHSGRGRVYQTPRDYSNTYGLNRYNRTRYFRHLNLLWTEYESSTHYSLKYNVTKPGLLISSGPQNGSSLDPRFNHFAGTIQVMKAVGTHLVLTFCFRLPDPKLYTVVMSRDYKLEHEDLVGVHNMLGRKGLHIISTKKLCRNNALRIETSSSCLLAIIVTIVIKIYGNLC